MGAGAVILIVLLIVLLAAAAAVGILFWRYYSLSNYKSDNEISAQTGQIDPSVLSESIGLTDSEVEEIQSAIRTGTLESDGTEAELPENKDVYNLLLVGVDRRDTSWNGNSDSMILATLNRKTKTLHLTSFMRDLYADIPGIGVRKLNNAYAVGGGPLLVQTIEQNYKVNIDNYAAVDFVGMAKIIDILGGVTLTVSDEEAEIADGYVRDMCQLQNISYEGHQFGSGGTYEADGLMAVGYSRIRYVGNSDYERTERQRTVVTQLMQKVKGMNAGSINSTVTKILPLVTHNIDSPTMLTLIMQVPTFMSYSLDQSRVPYDGLYTTRGEILVPDMAETIARLQEEIYGA